MYQIKINLHFFDVKVMDVLQLYIGLFTIWFNWNYPSIFGAVCGLVACVGLSLYVHARMLKTSDVYFIRRIRDNDDTSNEE